jgi:hypothetical protein
VGEELAPPFCHARPLSTIVARTENHTFAAKGWVVVPRPRAVLCRSVPIPDGGSWCLVGKLVWTSSPVLLSIFSLFIITIGLVSILNPIDRFATFPSLSVGGCTRRAAWTACTRSGGSSATKAST